MLSDVRIRVMFAVLVGVQGCAEGTKVDTGVEPTYGTGGALSTSRGGTSADSSGGKSSAARGGNLGSGGSSIRFASGGSNVTSSVVASGGRDVATGGSSIGISSSGGDSSIGGLLTSGSGSGGTASSSVAAPTAGLGIQIIMQQRNGNNQSATNLALVNQGAGSVNLATVKIRYYFTVDSFTAPVFEIDYAGQVADKSAIKASLFTLPTPLPNADRYFELTFTSGSLGVGSRTEINSRLHNYPEMPMTVDNDYSFTGTTGFTDHITVYVGNQLVWGVEPGTPGNSGAGGATGIGGAANGGVAGAYTYPGAGQGGQAGGTSSDEAGAAGTPVLDAAAGAAGVAESAGFAGALGFAGSS